MTREEIKSMTPYQDANDVLAEFVAGVKDVLGDDLVGIYLTGSLSYGDFVEERSDIDLEVVVKKFLVSEDIHRIEQLHRNISPANRWAKRIECSYVPLEILGEIMPPEKPRPWWGFDAMYAEAPAGNEWIINHYFLYNYGVALTGPEFKELISPVDMEEARKASARDLFKEWEPKLGDRGWLANPHYQSYLVLNLCRILATVIGAKPGSKKAAADWTKGEYPQWKELIEAAEEWGYGKEFDKIDEAIEFIKFAVQKVNEADII